MSYFHVHIVRNSDGKTSDLFFTDLSRKELIKKIVRPFHAHKDIHHPDVILRNGDIENIRIAESDSSEAILQKSADADWQRVVHESPIGYIPSPYTPEYFIGKEPDVTEHYIYNGGNLRTRIHVLLRQDPLVLALVAAVLTIVAGVITASLISNRP